MGESSVNRYISDLCRGCRCVELDLWDGADGEPEIYHGHTLTSRILARDVLDAIATWAFKASPFPLILSLENHLSAAQQCVMATLLRECLGDALLEQAPLGDGGAHARALPSPHELRGKIIVKCSGAPLGAATARLPSGDGDGTLDDYEGALDDYEGDDDEDDDDGIVGGLMSALGASSMNLGSSSLHLGASSLHLGASSMNLGAPPPPPRPRPPPPPPPPPSDTHPEVDASSGGLCHACFGVPDVVSSGGAHAAAVSRRLLAPPPKKTKPAKLTPELAALAALSGVKVHAFEENDARFEGGERGAWHMASFSEAKVVHFTAAAKPSEWSRYNARQLSRVYGARARGARRGRGRLTWLAPPLAQIPLGLARRLVQLLAARRVGPRRAACRAQLPDSRHRDAPQRRQVCR